VGGSKPQAPAPPPAPPSPGETSAQAIQAQIDALPKILAAQKEFGGQFSEEQLKSLSEFGPQFAQVGLDIANRFAPEFKKLEGQLNPEIAAAQESLTNFLKQSDDAEFQSLRPGLLEDVRSAQSLRGLGAISPLGSIDESVQLQRLKQSLKDRRINVALSTANRVPIGGIPLQGGFGAQTGTNQLVQNISPESIFNAQNSLNAFNSSIYNTQGGIFGNQLTNQTARRGQNITGATSLLETGVAGAFLLCWVASELFGGWFEPKTVGARNYISNIAPKWFKNLYIKYGERFAKFIKDKHWLKNMIRPIFEKFSEIGSRGI